MTRSSVFNADEGTQYIVIKINIYENYTDDDMGGALNGRYVHSWTIVDVVNFGTN